MDEKNKANIKALIQKAADATHAADAINFAQAACNVANALRALAEAETYSTKP